MEKLQDITEEQVVKEGFRSKYNMKKEIFYPDGYYLIRAWNSTIKKQDLNRYDWDTNPWVWAIKFERVICG